MIRVNLLTNSPGASQPRVLVPNEQRSAVIGVGMLLCTALTVGGWWYYLDHQLAATEASVVRTEAKIEQLKDTLKLLETQRQQKAQVEERLALIDRLRAAKHAPVRLLDLLNESVPVGLWLLEIKESPKGVQIEGRAMSHTAVTDFVQSIQNSGFFKMPVEIITTLMETVEDTNVIRFVLKAEPATANPAAPKSTAVTTPPPAGRPGS